MKYTYTPPPTTQSADTWKLVDNKLYITFCWLLLLLLMSLLFFFSPFSLHFAPIKFFKRFWFNQCHSVFYCTGRMLLCVWVCKQQLFFVTSKMICHPVRWISEHTENNNFISTSIQTCIVKYFHIHKIERANILPLFEQHTNKRFVFSSFLIHVIFFFFCLFYLFYLLCPKCVYMCNVLLLTGHFYSKMY